MKNFFLSCKELRIEPTSPKTYYGCFYLGPFETGQGLTVANALRRTLLSEIAGLAITSIKIESIFHEYSTLTGIRETVLDILLNLKEIVLKKNDNKPLTQTLVGYLQVRGPGTVRASDLKLPPTIQCVDPDQYIATLTENGTLSLKFNIDEGRTLVSTSQSFNRMPVSTFAKVKVPLDSFNFNKNLSNLNENYLPIDAVFTPIKKVNYTIETYGAESIEKANQVVILEIWTNGSISPKEAISQTLNYLRVMFNDLGQLKILQSIVTTYSLTKNKKYRKVLRRIENDLDLLQSHFYNKNFLKYRAERLLTKELQKTSKIQTTQEKDYLEEGRTLVSTSRSERIENQSIKEWNSRSINDLGLPYRIHNCLNRANIQTVGQILKLNVNELKNLPGFGLKSITLLHEILRSKGLTFN